MYETSSDFVRGLFEEHGEIKTFFDLIANRGMVFVTYYDLRAAERARERLQGSEISGRPIDVHYSLPRDDGGRGAEKDKQQQLQGTLIVTLKNSASGQPIDDNEVRRKFQQFGDVKSVRPAPGNDCRFVEFYDTRRMTNGVLRLGVKNEADTIADATGKHLRNAVAGVAGVAVVAGAAVATEGMTGIVEEIGAEIATESDLLMKRITLVVVVAVEDVVAVMVAGLTAEDPVDMVDPGRPVLLGHRLRATAVLRLHPSPRHPHQLRSVINLFGNAGVAYYFGAAVDERLERLEQAKKVQQLLAALKQPGATPGAPGNGGAPPPPGMPPMPPQAPPGGNHYYAAPPSMPPFPPNAPPPASAPNGYPGMNQQASTPQPPPAGLAGLAPNLLALLQQNSQGQQRLQQQQQQPPPMPYGMPQQQMMQPTPPPGMPQMPPNTQPNYQQLMAYLQGQKHGQ
ncbi:hypothetical protein EVJ58_g8129 [Rhodofomes roseus]|uniref:RRM domain-containing protein n=1 Tax=Rhodofomes roseus TaxID=34475 RepID=A0A4Y9Y1M5_9APHY|nr:hypothetical protein EVJ58_g8129 [Rhodofomes roseus]